jgi:hypothetical protein
MSGHTNWKDLLGSELQLNNRKARRSSAVRRGMVTGIGDEPAQQSLYDIAQGVKTDLGGDYHPQLASLPLQNLSIRRVGADRAEYVAEYGHYDTGSSADWGVEIDSVGPTQYVTGYANEGVSGVRWTPNEFPPTYTLTVPEFDIKRKVTFTSTSSINTLMSYNYPMINSSQVSFGGLTFGAYDLKLFGFAAQFDSADIADGVVVTYQFVARGVGLAYPPGEPNGAVVQAPWVVYRYKPITSRPYWELESIPEGPTFDFNNLPGI